jgi:RsiW-degrading membrane proteinase PrsW (M82 family)
MKGHRLHIALAATLASILLTTLGPAPFLAGLATALIPVPFYVLLALWLDRNEPEPRNLLARAFIWGMLVASLVSLVMNAAAIAYVQLTLGLSALVGQRIGTLLASPVFEEVSKGVALFLLFQRQRDEFDDAIDGVVYASMVGLGFAATENVLYYGNAVAHGRLASVFALRGLASPFAHPLFTAMTGIGFALARHAPDRRAAVLRVVAGLCAAITLHAMWNAAGAAHMFVQAYAVVMVPTFCGVLLLLRASSRREREIVRRFIDIELARHNAGAASLDAICTNAGVSGWVARRAGAAPARSNARTMHRVRRAAVELAFACWHDECSGKSDNGRVAALRTEFDTALHAWQGNTK